MYDASQGVWVRQGHRSGNGGLFAVIVGVSDYPYLPAASAALAKSFPALSSSAYTANRIFDWLTQRYRFERVPVAKCWLLLSPTPQEKVTLAPPATLDNIVRALNDWRDEMKAVKAGNREGTRALFFFSGHGMERDLEEQLLLPKDFYANRALNSAINTRNVYKGLAGTPIPWQLFLIDACRSDATAKSQFLNVRGFDALTIEPVTPNRRTAPIVYATASGEAAWQWNNPARPSVFGGALLEALELTGTPPLEPDCRSQPCVICLPALYSYVNARVSEILPNQQDCVAQGGVQLGDTPICHVDEPHHGRPGGTPASPIDRLQAQGVHPSLLQRVETTTRLQHLSGLGLLAPEMPLPEERKEPSARGISRKLHRLMSNARVYRWVRQWVSDPDPVQLESAYADEAYYRVRLWFKRPNEWHWLHIGDPLVRHAILFPPLDYSYAERQIFELQLGIESGHIIFARAQLSPTNEGLIGEAAVLWNKYRADGPSAAADGLVRYAEATTRPILSPEEKVVALELLFEKYAAPLGATIGALILTRAAQYGLMRNWLENLARIEFGSDGTVLALKRYVETEEQPSNKRISAYLEVIARTGLPFTSEATAYLYHLLDSLHAAEILPAVGRLQGTLRKIYAGFQTGGLFTGFTGTDDALRSILHPQLKRESSESVSPA